MLPGQTQNKHTFFFPFLLILTLFPQLHASNKALTQQTTVTKLATTKPICFSYAFPRETQDLTRRERDDVYTIATDTSGQLKTPIKLRTTGLLRVAEPESTPAYFSKKLLVLSFIIQQSLETMTAYEFFSLIDPKEEPISFANDNPITDFTISEDQLHLAVKSEQTWYIAPTPHIDQQTEDMFQPCTISPVEGQDCAVRFIPYTDLVILCYRSTINKNSPSYVYFRNLQTDRLIEKIDGHYIHRYSFITQNSETPFILLLLDDKSTRLCSIDGNTLKTIDKNIIHCDWKHNKSMTGYIVSTTKKDQQSTREYLKKEFQSTAPNTPESTVRRSSSSSSCESSTCSSLNSSPQSTIISKIEETLPLVHITQTPSPEPRPTRTFVKKLQNARN